MKKQQNITLQQLADHLEKGELIHKDFSILWFNKLPQKEHKYPNCGTVGCAMGEMPALDDRFTFDTSGDLYFLNHHVYVSAISKYFNISVEEAWHLFFPRLQNTFLYGGKDLESDATKEDVIFNIREFLKLKQK
jgi:hypothetical protein